MHRQDNTQQCGQSNCRLSHKECYHWKDIFAFLGISLNRCWGYFLMAYQLSPVQGPSHPMPLNMGTTLHPAHVLQMKLKLWHHQTLWCHISASLGRSQVFLLWSLPPEKPRFLSFVWPPTRPPHLSFTDAFASGAPKWTMMGSSSARPSSATIYQPHLQYNLSCSLWPRRATAFPSTCKGPCLILSILPGSIPSITLSETSFS